METVPLIAAETAADTEAPHDESCEADAAPTSDISTCTEDVAGEEPQSPEKGNAAKLPKISPEKLAKMKTLIQAMQKQEEESSKQGEAALINAFTAASEASSSGDFEDAIPAWTRVIELDDTVAQAWWQRGSAKAALGQRDEAEADFAEALKHAQDDSERAGIYFSRGSARSDADDEIGAVEDFTETLNLEPSRLEAWCCRGTAALSQGNIEAAASDAESALKIDAECAAAWGLLGAARRAQGRLREAVDNFERALSIEPELDWVLGCLAEARPALDSEEAESDDGDSDKDEKPKAKTVEKKELEPNVKESKATDSKDQEEKAQLFREEGNDLFRQGMLQNAELAYARACEVREEGWVLAASNLAICRFKLQDYDLAIEAANSVIEACEEPNVQATDIEPDKKSQTKQKAQLTKFKCLAGQGHWVPAFSTMRALRASCEDRSTDVAKAIFKEEMTWREVRRKYCDQQIAAGKRSIPAEPQPVAETLLDVLRRIVKGAEVQPLEQLDVVVAGDSEARFKAAEVCLSSAQLQPELLAEGSSIRLIDISADPEEDNEKTTESDSPLVRLRGPYQRSKCQGASLVILWGADLASDLAQWLPTLQSLQEANILTAVLGSGYDDSVIQNEDVLLTMGFKVAMTTTLLDDKPQAEKPTEAAEEDYEEPSQECAHVLTVKGDSGSNSAAEKFDLQFLREALTSMGIINLETPS